jgi:uncharacterized Zn finger protein
MRRSSRSSFDTYYGFAPYVPVAARKADAARKVTALRAKGRDIRPVVLSGQRIAATFWGKAWCAHLESYSDYSNRLPRGRTYVRSGCVVDLQVAPGEVTALVQGSSLYEVRVTIEPVEPARWERIVRACAGGVASVVELLRGKLSDAVMTVLTTRETGLFPAPKSIRLACSCPDSATMCKHVAATLYGVGARLDEEPELLFRLRGTDPQALVATAARGAVTQGRELVAKDRILAGADLESVFGIELDDTPPPRRATTPKTGKPAPTAVVAGRPAKKPRPEEAAKAPPAQPPSVAATRSRRKPTPADEPAPAAVRTAAEFARLGVPPETVAFWVRIGALTAGPRRGAYLETSRAPEFLGRYLATAQQRAGGRAV